MAWESYFSITFHKFLKFSQALKGTFVLHAYFAIFLLNYD